MRLALITTIWRRPELTRAVLNYYSTMPFHVRVAAVSPEDPNAEYYNRTTFPEWEFVLCPNRPLGEKFNRALMTSRIWTPDAVMVVGSDDLVDPKYIQLVGAALEKYKYVHPEDLHVFQDGQTYFLKPFPTGAGRVVRKDALDEVGWKLWPSVDVFLDGQMDRTLDRVAPRQFQPSHEDYNFCIMDVKTGVNMWRLEGSEILSGDRRVKVREVREVEPLWHRFPGFQYLEAAA